MDELYPNKRPSNVIIKLDESFRGGIFQNITLLPKGDFENPYQLKDLIDKFKSLNPDFDLNKLLVVDNIEVSDDEYLRKLSQLACRILVTSRYRELSGFKRILELHHFLLIAVANFSTGTINSRNATTRF